MEAESASAESVMPPANSLQASMPTGGVESGFDWVALLQQARQYKASIVLLTPAITLFLWFFVSYQLSPLKRYPGPFLAGSFHLSNLVPSFWILHELVSPQSALYMHFLPGTCHTQPRIVTSVGSNTR